MSIRATLLVSLGSLLMATGCCCAPYTQTDQAVAIKVHRYRLKGGVVGREAVASAGAWLDDRTIVMSAEDVVRAYKIAAKTPAGRRVRLSGVVAIDRRRGVALIRARASHSQRGATLLRPGRTSQLVDQQMTLVADSAGLGQSVFAGRVHSVPGSARDAIVVFAPTSLDGADSATVGSGPLFTSEGRLAGICHVPGRGQQRRLVSPAADIADVYYRHHLREAVPLTKASSLRSLPLRALTLRGLPKKPLCLKAGQTHELHATVNAPTDLIVQIAFVGAPQPIRLITVARGEALHPHRFARNGRYGLSLPGRGPWRGRLTAPPTTRGEVCVRITGGAVQWHRRLRPPHHDERLQ